jgi:hypothetical protein
MFSSFLCFILRKSKLVSKQAPSIMASGLGGFSELETQINLHCFSATLCSKLPSSATLYFETFQEKNNSLEGKAAIC